MKKNITSPILSNEQTCLLLPEDTFQRFGYQIKDLSFASNKKIIHKCISCSCPKENTYQRFVKNIALSHRECAPARQKQICLEKYGVTSTSLIPEVRERQRQTRLQRYGVDNPFKSSKVQEKAKQTRIKKYGVDNLFKLPEVQKRIKQNNLKEYGVEHPLQSKEILEKMKQTCLEKYGVDNPRKAEEVKEKIIQTILKRYGVEHPAQSPEILERMKQTLKNHYGVEYSLQSSEIREKIKQTMLGKYGVSHRNLLPQHRNKLKDWCTLHSGELYTSGPEQALLEWVQTMYPNAKKYKDGVHEIDVFISDINLGIEHNGLYWHQENIVGQHYHINKTKYFEAKNIRILHIFEHEWKNRQQQVKSFLQSAMGKNEHKIGARKCTLQWCSSPEDLKEVHDFLETYHIQGAPINTKYVVKVLHDNDLLAVATFGKHHRNNSKDNWVLTRFCTKTNYTIQGVLSRISKLASQQIKEDIVSWADYRLSQGNGYEKAGWVFEELLPPDYFYHKGIKVFSKQSRQKKTVNTPEGMTERQHAEADGLARVYDCGKIRYKYICKIISQIQGESNGTI
jgi:hypothetical protein